MYDDGAMAMAVPVEFGNRMAFAGIAQVMQGKL